IASPMTKTVDEENYDAGSEEATRTVIPDTRIRVPIWPRVDGISISLPRIIFGNVDSTGTGRLDRDRRVFHPHGFLRCGLKSAGCFCPLAHHLYGIHHILFLVVVGVPQRRRPGKVLVHISKDGWECSERLDARVPGLLVHSLSQSVALQIRMRLHPSVSF